MGRARKRSKREAPSWEEKALVAVVFVVLLPVVLAVLFALVVYWVLSAVVYRILVEVQWARHGRRILLVTSDSPVWHDYIEEHWLPRLDKNAIVLNWSERATWDDHSLAVRIFRHSGGDRNFNPMVMVFPPFRKSQSIGFFYAFRDWKHGKTTALKEAEAEMFDLVDSVSNTSPQQP